MEAHEYIVQTVVEFALDIACVHILRYGVVDIQQGNCIVAYAGTDELRQSAINIYFAGYRDSSTGQTAVYIAGNESELCLECRPAFSSQCYVFRYPLCSSIQSSRVSSY